MLALKVRLRLCFALLRICDECRHCGDTGDINGFTGVNDRLSVIPTRMLHDGDVDVDI